MIPATPPGLGPGLPDPEEARGHQQPFDAHHEKPRDVHQAPESVAGKVPGPGGQLERGDRGNGGENEEPDGGSVQHQSYSAASQHHNGAQVSHPVFNYTFMLRLYIATGLVSPQHHVDRCLAEESRRGLSGPPENDVRLAELQPSTERHEVQHQQHRSKHALAPKQPHSGSTEDLHVQRDVL